MPSIDATNSFCGISCILIQRIVPIVEKPFGARGDRLDQGLDRFLWAKGDRLRGTGIPIKLSMSSFHSLYHHSKNRICVGYLALQK